MVLTQLELGIGEDHIYVVGFHTTMVLTQRNTEHFNKSKL